MESGCETHSAQSRKFSFGRTTCRSQGTTTSTRRGLYIKSIEASEWVSPIVFAHKPDGRVRLCVDLRDVNSKIIVEGYPMPNIHEMLLMLESAKVFTTIDLSSAYHQIPLTDESKDITAFITTKGLFRFPWIPFGLASASSVFHHMMHKIFKYFASKAARLRAIIKDKVNFVWEETRRSSTTLSQKLRNVPR